MIIALALLPAEKIEEGLSQIENLAYEFAQKQDTEAAEEAEKTGKNAVRKI